MSGWDILWSLQSACVHLLIQPVGFHWSRLTFCFFFLSSLLVLFYHHFFDLHHLLLFSCLPTPPLMFFTLTVLLLFLLLLYRPFPFVNPSDCRVKLWNYVPGLTPCLPRRVLAIKGRATSLPWLPLLRSPTLPSSGTLLANFHLLVPAVSFPLLLCFLYLRVTCTFLFTPVLFLSSFSFLLDSSFILFFCFLFSVWLSYPIFKNFCHGYWFICSPLPPLRQTTFRWLNYWLIFLLRITFFSSCVQITFISCFSTTKWEICFLLSHHELDEKI